MSPNPCPYLAYKCSSVQWIGNVPEHWKLRRLKDFATIIAGQSPPSEIVSEYQGNFPFLQGNAEFGHVHPSAQWSCESPPRWAKTDDILLSVRAPVGALNVADQCYGIGRGLCAVRSQFSLHRIYTYYTLGVANQEFLRQSTGSTYDAVTIGIVGGLAFPIPPIIEQTAIVRFLNQADRRSRRYVHVKQKLLSFLEEQKQAIIHQAVMGQIDVRTGNPYLAYKLTGEEWLGKVPEHWEVRRFKTVCRIRYGLGQPPSESPDGLPLIRATNVDNGRIIDRDLLYVDLATLPTGWKAILKEGEIIVVRSGAYTADSAIVPKAYDGAVAGYDMVATVIGARPEFVAIALLSSYLRDDQLIIASTRSAQPHLNAEELGSSLLLVPPLSEQSTIVEYLEKTTADIDTFITHTRRQIELIQEYRTRLIAGVVTGKLDVRELAAELPDIEDVLEPADGLKETDKGAHI